MASEELTAEAWLIRGIEAYRKQRLGEAAQHFEKAVVLKPDSLDTHLALGATRLTMYHRRGSTVATLLGSERNFSPQDFERYREIDNAALAEQNSTNWPLAETSLKRANELDPQNKLVAEYLAALYFFWKDPRNEKNDRFDESKRWLERILVLRPDDKWASYQCGMVLYAKAAKLLPNYGRFPPVPDPDLAFLRREVTPLLEEAIQHFTRVLALPGDPTGSSYFLDQVQSLQAYLADPEKAARDLHEKRTASFRRLQAKASQSSPGKPVPSSSKVTFRLSPEALAEDKERPFPPNPWRI